MNTSKRQIVIAGNWKMNKNAEETKILINEMKTAIKDCSCKVLLCVPAINISTAVEAAKDSLIEIGAQNCHWAASGAFTGEISADMLKSFGLKYAIIGHSERRQYFGETDKTVNMRSLACLENDITPIICVGENLEERENGTTKNVIKKQITEGLCGFTSEQLNNTIIAYEPVWAIGTGKTASAQQAEEVCSYIRNLLGELFCPMCAEKVSILYGGSMNASNAKELLSMPNIDGGLIGGASLKSDDFSKIVESAK